MKKKFLIFLILFMVPFFVNAGSKDDKTKICSKGTADHRMVTIFIETAQENPGDAIISFFQRITIYDFKTSEGNSAYCLEPGKKADVSHCSHEYYMQEDFLNEECKISTDGLDCGLAAILGYVNQEENKSKYDYVETLTALRLWASYKGSNEHPDTGIWTADGFLTKTQIYKTTGQYLRSNPSFTGHQYNNGVYDQSYSNLPHGVLFVPNEDASSLKQIDNSFFLFREAAKGIEVFVANIKPEKEEYQFDEYGKAVIKLITNFDSNTKDVEITSEDVTVDSVDTVGACGENQYCYDVHVSIPLEDLKTCDNKDVTFNVKYNDSRDVLSHVKKYETNNSDYQTFVVYDEDAKDGEKEVKAKIVCEEPTEPTGDKCPETPMTYEGSTECSGYEDTQEYKIEDPKLCTVMNMDKEKYKLKDIKYTYGSKMNTLCSVYCREKILFKFMGKKDVIAGRTFKYSVQGNTLLEPNKYITAVIATRECASKNIEYETWKKNYEEINAKMLEAWNNFKLWEARYKNEKKHNERQTCAQCGCGTCPKVVTYTDYYTDLEGNLIPFLNYKYEYENDNCIESRNESWTWYEWVNATYTYTNSDGNTVTKDASGSSGNDNLNYSCTTCSASSTCSGNPGQSAQSEMTKYKGEYNAYRTQREEMLDAINDCSYLKEEGIKKDILEYTFKADSSVEYEDYYTDLIKIEGEQSDQNDIATIKYCNGGNCKYKDICPTCETDPSSSITEGLNRENLIFWECSGEGTNSRCEKQTKDVPISKAAYVTTEKEEAYYQSVNFFTEIYTGNVNTTGGNNYIPIEDEENQTNYLYPIELKKANGEYDVVEAFKNINKEFRKKLGLVLIKDIEYKCSIEVCNETVLYEGKCDEEPDPPGCDRSRECCPGDTYLNNKNCAKGDDYCHSETTCCPGDMYPYNKNCPEESPKTSLGFIFRPIEMESVFPNLRAVGRNWSTSLSVIDAIESISKDFWSETTPQYSVTITPNQLNQIKAYNLTQNSSGGYLNYSLNCTDSSGDGNPANCTSTFLKDKIATLEYATRYETNINETDKKGNFYTWRKE